MTRSITIASSADGATMRSRPVAMRSMRAGERSVSISSRRCRLIALAGALALHLLEAIAMAEQLEVLPGREQQHEDEEDANQRRAPHLAVTLAIDLADDRVVADVFLDCVFEGLGRHVRTACSSRIAARSLRYALGDFVRSRLPSAPAAAWSGW